MICWLMVDLGWWVSELVGNLIVLMWLGLLWFCWVLLCFGWYDCWFTLGLGVSVVLLVDI